MAIEFSKKKLLVIDDFANMRSLLRKMVESFGITQVDQAANAKEALAALAEQRYDIILCDYNLGEGKNGQQLLEEAKHRQLFVYSTVFVMITAENTVDMVMGAMEYRPDDYLAKPINKEVLRNRLETLLEKKGELEPLDRLVLQGRYPEAQQLLDKHIAQKPRYLGELLRLKGDIALQFGDLAGAENVYDTILKSRPLPWALLGKARLHFERGDYAATIEACRNLIAQQHTMMEAYDLLARSARALGDNALAQQTLQQAVTISPIAIRRQRMLGEVAHENGDLAVAGQALRRSIDIGRQSVFKAADDYTQLAKLLVETGEGRDAVRMLHNLRSEFRGDKVAQLQAAAAEGVVMKKLNREAEARKAYDEATALAAELEGSVSAAAGDLIQSHLLFGNKEAAFAVMKELVRNNHDDEHLAERLGRVFAAAGLEEEARGHIHTTKSEVARLNNQGVALFREGKVAESMRLFRDVVAQLPNNVTVNLNAARVHIEYAEKVAAKSETLEYIERYLDTVRKINPQHREYLRLRGRYEKMVEGATS